jgi:alkylation response protein AidB-like acyl-CoA dehydrogenase
MLMAAGISRVYGYMRDDAIGRAFPDARAQRICGGTNEIMKEMISRTN